MASVINEVAGNIAYQAQRKDPKEAVKHIWASLEKAYGNSEEIVADLLKNISRARNPLPSKYDDLQKYWFRLDECKVVLTGMKKKHLLKKGKLLNKLVDGLATQRCGLNSR